MKIYIYCAGKGLQIWTGEQNQNHGAVQTANKSSFKWISNPGAIHQKGMQSCNRNPDDAWSSTVAPLPLQKKKTQGWIRLWL